MYELYIYIKMYVYSNGIVFSDFVNTTANKPVTMFNIWGKRIINCIEEFVYYFYYIISCVFSVS